MLLLLALLAGAAPPDPGDPRSNLPEAREPGSDPPALDGALFRRDGQTLSEEGTFTLQAVATYLKSHPEVQVVILVPGRIRRGDPYWWTQQVAAVEQFLLARGLGPERIGLPLQPGGPVPPRLPSAPRPVQPPADLLELDFVQITLGAGDPAPLVPVLPMPQPY